MKRKIGIKIVIGFLILILLSSGGLAISKAQFTETFDDGDASDWNDGPTGPKGIIYEKGANASAAINGSHGFRLDCSDDNAGDTACDISNKTSIEFDYNESFTFTFWFNASRLTTDANTNQQYLAIRDLSSGQQYHLGHKSGDFYLRVKSNISDIEYFGTNFIEDKKHNYTFKVNKTSNTTTLYVDGSQEAQSGFSINFDNSSDKEIYVRNRVEEQGASQARWQADWDTITLNQTEAGNLTLDVDTFMKHDTKQSYKVFENDEEITSQASVTSSNTSIIEVNETTNELIATNDTSINKEVTITATFEGGSVSKNVTVANRTLDNIGKMPSEQWIPSFLGFDDENNVSTIGGEGQWILLIIAIGTFLAKRFSNEYIGLGSITILLILAWRLGNISLGLVLVGTVYSIFAGYQLLRTPSRTNVNVKPTNE